MMDIGIQQIAIFALIIWFFIFLLGMMQMNRIKKRLFNRIDETIDLINDRGKEITLDEIYNIVFADWDELVHSSAKFVLSKNELYPVPANPTKIKERLNLSPVWLGAYLRLQGAEPDMTNSQKEKVNEILKLATKK